MPARACYSREVGRELAAVGGTAPATSRSSRRRQQRGDVRHGGPATPRPPLLCDLHLRVGVTDEQVPSWLGWTEPLASPVMNRRALLAGLRSSSSWSRSASACVFASGGGDGRRARARRATTAAAEPPSPAATGDLDTCAGLVQDEGRSCYSRELAAIVNGAADPLAAVEGITEAAYADQTGFLLANCHGIMHTVAREYALRTELTLAKLMDSLPRTNDPGCSAGYAHGLVTAVAPEIEKAGPKVATKPVRQVRDALPALQLHARLRARVHAPEQRRDRARRCRCASSSAPAPPPDCSQGIYHDYWFAVNGIDATAKPKDAVTDPRELCGAQPEQFVRACWYRAFVETAKGTRMESGEQTRRACAPASRACSARRASPARA